MSKVDKLCIRREPPVLGTEKMCDQLLLRHLFLSTKTGATYAKGKQTWKRMFVQEVGVVEQKQDLCPFAPAKSSWPGSFRRGRFFPLKALMASSFKGTDSALLRTNTLGGGRGRANSDASSSLTSVGSVRRDCAPELLRTNTLRGGLGGADSDSSSSLTSMGSFGRDCAPELLFGVAACCVAVQSGSLVEMN